MYGTQPKSQFSKKAMYNYFERTPIKIDYATVPTADEWRATLRYRELVENASLALPPRIHLRLSIHNIHNKKIHHTPQIL